MYNVIILHYIIYNMYILHNIITHSPGQRGEGEERDLQCSMC